MAKPLINPVKPWIPDLHRSVVLFHGCLQSDADSIKKNGIDPTRGRINTDFGRGFYTTTLERQAEQWALLRYRQQTPSKQRTDPPVVIRFRVGRSELAHLEMLSFVRCAYDAEDFWSLVQHCRQSSAHPNHHGHPEPSRKGWYDSVWGPVAAFWEQRVAMQDADQISFHTQAAAAVLNLAKRHIRRLRIV